MNKTFLVFLSLVLSVLGFSQGSAFHEKSFTIVPTFNDQPIVLGEKQNLFGDELVISTLKFYISHLEFWNDGTKAFELGNYVQLVDMIEPASTHRSILLPTGLVYDEMRFVLGLDSSINVADAPGGDLNKTLGLYSKNQSGYLNFIIEGETTIIPNEDKGFKYHLGGDQPPFETAQDVTFQMDEKEELRFALNLALLMGNVDFKGYPEILSPGKAAMIYSKMLASSIYQQ